MSRPEVPRGVLAYLTVSDAGRAIEFYRHAFSATELYRQESDDGRLLHCELEINGGRADLGQMRRHRVGVAPGMTRPAPLPWRPAT